MKFEHFNKSELEKYCIALDLDIRKKKKAELIEAVYEYERNEIDLAIKDGRDNALLFTKISSLADEYANNLKQKIKGRKKEMEADDNSHYLIYCVLGISETDGKQIDEYQNTGRFLYKYAGSFLEEAASLCLAFSNSSGSKTTIKNTEGARPKTFEIDFLNGNNAIELKWRDATTDGDHITKEHSRVIAITKQGYTPVRIMFYYPQREQAIKIQKTLETLYAGVSGQYYAGENAWKYLEKISGYSLKSILLKIAEGRTFE